MASQMTKSEVRKRTNIEPRIIREHAGLRMYKKSSDSFGVDFIDRPRSGHMPKTRVWMPDSPVQFVYTTLTPSEPMHVDLSRFTVPQALQSVSAREEANPIRASILMDFLLDTLPPALYAVAFFSALYAFASLENGDHGSLFIGIFSFLVFLPVGIVSSRVNTELSRRKRTTQRYVTSA